MFENTGGIIGFVAIFIPMLMGRSIMAFDAHFKQTLR